MIFHYTSEKNVQIVLSLLKEHNIKKVIVSPGATNESFVASMQSDPYFEMYSCVDERSAAYMACGMAEESGEIIVLSCTGATSSRNYLPGLTEAYYRKLPLLVITSSMDPNKIGHLYPQCTNRSTPPQDTVISSYCIGTIKDEDDQWDNTVKVNHAIADLTSNGGGPVHINLITRGCNDYSVKSLPKTRVIRKISYNDAFPDLKEKKILIFIGSHHKWSQEETQTLDQFCQKYNTVALCDQTSNYKGKFRVLSSLICAQENIPSKTLLKCDVLIHIGEISGDYYTMGAIKTKEVWRVDIDGKIKDKFKQLTFVFSMPEKVFFEYYIQQKNSNNYLNPINEFKNINSKLLKEIDNLPFSNIWIASQLAHKLPKNSVLHLGILNSLRAWNFFDIDRSINSYCNVGGFGIDGILSSLIGASLVDVSKLYFGVVGDLAFFYDINSIGNRHIGNNLRIIVINNGRGVEFHTYKHSAAKFGEDTDKYIAAYGHNGKQSPTLIKNIAESLGFKYICASSKETFNIVSEEFIASEQYKQPVIFEIFTKKNDDADVLRLIRTLNGKMPNDTIRNIYHRIISKFK